MKRINFVLPILLVYLLTSCVSKKSIVYFQNDSIDQAKVSNAYKTIFKPDDLLQITVSSSDIEAVKPFNLPAVTFATTTDAVVGQPSQQLLLIDNKGNIDFPVIGTFKIGGLTRDQAIASLKSKLSPEYIKDPSINIRIANFKITVLGDVGRPGVYNIPNERITILEAIGLAGDLNISGVRSNVKVEREENNTKVFYEIDLRSKKIFTSPVFYLQQNDVIYVEQNKTKMQGAGTNPNAGIFISIASVLISILTLAIR